MQQDRRIELLQFRILRGKAPVQQIRHADEHERAENIRPEPEQTAKNARVNRRQHLGRDVAFDEVDDIHQPVENETVKDKAVEEADDRPVAEHGHLRDRTHDRITDPRDGVIRAGIVRRGAAVDHADDLTESQVRVVQRDDEKNGEKKLLRKGQHGGEGLRAMSPFATSQGKQIPN